MPTSPGEGEILTIKQVADYLKVTERTIYRRVVLQPIAVKKDGTRVPVVERQFEHYLSAPPATPQFSADDRLELFS